MGLFDEIKDAVGMSDEDKARRAEEDAKKAQSEAEAARQKAGGETISGGSATVDGGKDAAPKTEPVSASTAGERTYTVKPGDTLSEIGAKLGVSWQKIAEVNNVANPDLIHPGQVFKIPS